MIDAVVKYVTGIVKLRGATDGTQIGNVGSSLNTNVTASTLPTGAATETSLVAVTTALTAQKVTYSAGATFSPPATPTDTFRIRGSATKTIKVRRIALSTTQTTAGTNTFYLIKRITANTGGTLPVATAAPHDSNSAATATVAGYYSVNPTGLGTSAGNIDTLSLYSPTVTSTAQGTQKVWDFNQSNIEPIVLRGTAESLAINFNGAALPAGLVIHASIMWTEE